MSAQADERRSGASDSTSPGLRHLTWTDCAQKCASRFCSKITFTTCRPSLPNGCSPVHLEIRSWDKTLSAGSLEHFEPCLTACATGTWRKTIVCSTVPCKRRSWLDRKERRSLLHRWTQNLALPSEASHDAHNVMLAALQLWFLRAVLPNFGLLCCCSLVPKDAPCLSLLDGPVDGDPGFHFVWCTFQMIRLSQ